VLQFERKSSLDSGFTADYFGKKGLAIHGALCSRKGLIREQRQIAATGRESWQQKEALLDRFWQTSLDDLRRQRKVYSCKPESCS